MRLRVFVLSLVVGATPSLGVAQPLGTFRWQLQPYCNIVSLTVVQQGGQYLLDGTDDQCGAPRKAAINGLAFLNPDGSVGFGLTIVTAPGGVPVHLDATIALSSLSGAWRDNTGAEGPFAFTPGAGTGGSPRPLSSSGVTAVTAGAGLSGGGAGHVSLAVDFAATQQRVTGICPAGARMTGINQDGSVVCQAVSSATGDITGVAAGSGLAGGGTAGDVSLSVLYGGSGMTALAARSDHTHTDTSFNTAIGPAALQTGVGSDNVAIGYRALELNAEAGNTAVGSAAARANTTGLNLVAIGAGALAGNTSGFLNTAAGAFGLWTNTTGSDNTAVGYAALFKNLSGSSNTAVGSEALRHVTSGGSNIAVGVSAGASLTTGGGNILIGSPAGSPAESSTIRIGQSQTASFVAGIHGATVSGGIPVLIDGAGHLGTATSSSRFKDDVHPLGDSLRDRIQALTPVSFVYKPELDDGSRLTQYGLIAEEVAERFPEQLVRDAAGRPQTVRSHLLPPLLLAEVQRLERARAALEDRVRALETALMTILASGGPGR